MRGCTAIQVRRLFLIGIIVAGIPILAGMAGCGSTKPAAQPAAPGPQRYHLTGRVVSVEPAKQQVEVDADDIPGFMMAMKMGYAVKDPNQLTPLSAEDKITADVVVNGSDVYLENIVVTKKADQAMGPAMRGPSPAPTQPAKQ